MLDIDVGVDQCLVIHDLQRPTLVPSIWPRIAFKRPPLRLARREPTEEAAIFELAAVPITLKSGDELNSAARLDVALLLKA